MVKDEQDDDQYWSRSRSDRRRRSSRSPRSRSRSRSRSPPRRRRSRSPEDRKDRRSRSPREMSDSRAHKEEGDDYSRGSRSGSYRGGSSTSYDPARRSQGREIAAQEAAKRSIRENRVYVGNLSFQVRWNDLKDFMRDAGNVIFAEVMTLPNGMSKGCGVVEYSTREEALKAVETLNEQSLLGRQVFIREDREEEARYGAAAVSGRPGYEGADTGRGGYRGGRGGGAFGAFGSGRPNPPAGTSKQLYVGGLNWEVGWQDLKDLFRQSGDIIRADIHYGTDGNPKGSGSVVFTSPADAQNAIAMFDGAELNGMKLEVREERFAAPQSGPFGRGGTTRGGFAPRGGRGGYSTIGQTASPSNQIFVKNLPWSTSNDDLIELFQTTGTVEFAEALAEGGRSKGCGIIQFASMEEAESAIGKFQAYNYGGRPLAIEFNARYRDFVAQPVQPNVGGGDPGDSAPRDSGRDRDRDRDRDGRDEPMN